MSGEKKRYRWRRGPILIEENLIINSTSSTTTTKTQEEKHTENIRRKWYKNNEDDDDEDIQLSTLLPNETISEKIDRVIRKIDAWTNETSTTTDNNHNNTTIKQGTSFTKTTKPSFNYESTRRRPYDSNITKPTYNSIINSFRRRCSSSTYSDTSMTKVKQIPTHRPYSMTFIDEPSPMTRLHDNKSSYQRPTRKTKAFHRQSSLESNRYQQQRRSLYSPTINPISLSSMYGSDFFYPPAWEQDQHEYDNLTLIQKSSRNHYEPFPTIVVDCQRCSRSVDRSSLRDISCQVPSDEEIYQDIQFHHDKTSRSSPLYVSPRTSPTLCHPPLAGSLLAPYHSRRKNSLSSYAAMHNRSKSVPSTSSTTSSKSSRKSCLLPTLSPLPMTLESDLVPSTNTLLRSIKTSIHAMKKRLKDIRRLSEWVCLLDDSNN